MVDLTNKTNRALTHCSAVGWSGCSRPRSDGLFGEPAEQTTQVEIPNADGSPSGQFRTVTNNVSQNSFQGIVGLPGLNTTLPFQMQDWELTGIRWDQIFALSSERNDVRIFSTPSLMVSHNAPEVHILIEDERNIVVPPMGTVQPLREMFPTPGNGIKSPLRPSYRSKNQKWNASNR